MNQKYNLTINFLEYYRLRGCLKNFLNSIYPKNLKCTRPYIPYIFNILKKPKNDVNISTALINCKQNPKPRIRWSEKLGIDITPGFWQAANRLCIKTIDSNQFKRFQYRILNRILGTREYLVKLMISDSATFFFCEVQTETIIHFFTSCKNVQQFWHDIN